MRTFLFLLLCSTAMHAQMKNLPEIPFNWYNSEMLNRDFKELKIKNRKAIIVHAGTSGMFESDNFSRYLIFYPDGDVQKVTATQELKPVITNYPLTEEQKKIYWDYLTRVLQSREIFADITKFMYMYKSREERNKDTTIILDGYSESFNIYQDNKLLYLPSDNSRTFIGKKTDGWEERVKIVKLVEDFKVIFGVIQN